MTEATHALLDRYMSGDATLDEQQVLAREALRDPDLFELLATIGATQAALDRDRSAVPAVTPVQHGRRHPMLWAGLVAAAAVAMLAIRFLPWPRRIVPPQSTVTSAPTDPASAPTVGVVRHPSFLAARLDLPQGSPGASFRSIAGARSMAKDEGVIQSSESGSAVVDLGLLDGLGVGAIVQIDADPILKLPPGTAKVSAAFRDKSRLEVGPDVKTGRHVRVTVSTHLRALSTLITDATAAGDAELVRAAAMRASVVARDDAAQADLRRQVLVQLAALARRRNDAAATEQYLREAVALAEAPPPASADDRGEVLNALGTVLAASGNVTEAEATLRQAQTQAPPDSTIAGQILNNLGAIAALRGDLSRARVLYQSALALMPGSADRSRRVIVENNLALIGSPR